MQFLNPKVVLFTMTVILSFVLPYYDSTVALSLSVLGITFIGFIAFLLWVLFGAIFKQFYKIIKSSQCFYDHVLGLCSHHDLDLKEVKTMQSFTYKKWRALPH